MNTFLDFLFPRREDAKRVAVLTPAVMETKLHPVQIGKHLALSSFSDPDVRACIHELKFHDSEAAAELLAALFRAWLKTHNHSYTFVPLPLSRKRQKERGYNQIERVLAHTNVARGTINTTLLVRHRHTAPQTTLRKQERQHNLVNAFRYTGTDIRSKELLLLDDVLTTGATLSAARAALEEGAPKQLVTIALAH